MADCQLFQWKIIWKRPQITKISLSTRNWGPEI